MFIFWRFVFECIQNCKLILVWENVWIFLNENSDGKRQKCDEFWKSRSCMHVIHVVKEKLTVCM